jgi:hypothetical protein
MMSADGGSANDIVAHVRAEVLFENLIHAVNGEAICRFAELRQSHQIRDPRSKI